jgi:predicted dehydrogenase
MREGEIRFGVIGLGVVSQRDILPRFPFEKNLRLVAVCDIVEERAKTAMRQFGAEEYYTDYEKLLADADIDVVCNLTPIGFHYPISLAALKAGKHLYTQKAMTTSVEEATDLINLANRKRLKLVASPGQLLNPYVAKARELVHQGAIGKVSCARGNGVAPQHEKTLRGDVDPTWYYKRNGGGPLYDHTVYVLHSLTGILGPAKRVSAFSGTSLPERKWKGKDIAVEVDDNTMIILDFGNSTYACIDATSAVSCGGEVPMWEIYGSNGTIIGEWNGIRVYFEQKVLGFQSGWFTPARPWLDELEPIKPGDPKIWADILHLVECIQQDKKPIASGEHARHVIEIIEKSYESAKIGSVQGLHTTFNTD